MAKMILWVFGVVFTLVGILGFFMPSPLLGIFMVNDLHNVVHLITGLVFLGTAFMAPGACRAVAKLFGVIYAIVAVLGFVMGGDMILGLIMNNMADNALHTVVALVLLYAGFMGKAEASSSMGASMSA